MTDETMRRRLTISVPSDVAERLNREPNASAYVVQTVRARIRADAVRAELAAAGITVTEAGAARARARRLAVEADWPRERRDAARRRALDTMRAEIPAGDAATRTDAA